MLDLRIDADRFREDFRALAAIGATADGGVDRPALSEAHLAARRWFRRRVEADGFGFHADGAGNHSALLAGPAETPTLLLGSHLDSVPRGGRFDGALGVLAALAVLRAVRDAGAELPFGLEAIDFTDEEGTLVGLLGSRALVGTLTPEELAAPRGGREALQAGLRRAGLDEAGVLTARRPPAALAGYLELHIEQGPRLADSGNAIGIVSSIVGMASAEWVFSGSADHAGTTPLPLRRDAGLAAARAIVDGTTWVARELPDCVVTFGRLGFAPGAFNIVPGEAHLAVEYRAPDAARLAALGRGLAECAEASARSAGVEVEQRPRGTLEPTPCAPRIREAFAAACERLGAAHETLASGAGHDAMALAGVCPSGMIFVPSTGGSHSPRESCAWDDCVRGANVLLHAVLHLGERAGRR